MHSTHRNIEILYVCRHILTFHIDDVLRFYVDNANRLQMITVFCFDLNIIIIVFRIYNSFIHQFFESCLKVCKTKKQFYVNLNSFFIQYLSHCSLSLVLQPFLTPCCVGCHKIVLITRIIVMS